MIPETNKRLYIGGLSEDVTTEALTKKFKKFGVVGQIDIHKKKNITDDSMNVFAFLNLSTSPENINKCISSLNNEEWKGGVLKLQLAKESFLDRLNRERLDSKKSSIVKEWQPHKTDNTQQTKIKNNTTQKNKKIESKNYINDTERILSSSVYNTGKDSKQQRSNDTRIESIKQKQAHLQQQANILKQSLSGSTVNKKVVYNSDDEDDEEEDEKRSDDKEKKLSLFDEDEEDDSEDDDDDRFKIKKQFKGKSGEKLFEMQMKFNDARFKLDERFVDEEDEEEDDVPNKKKKYDNSDEENMEAEKERNMKILRGVVKLKEEKKNTVFRMSEWRYDPAKAEDSRFEKDNEEEDEEEEEKKDEPKNKKRKTEAKKESPKKEAASKKDATKKYVKISDGFTESFNTHNPFTLSSIVDDQPAVKKAKLDDHIEDEEDEEEEEQESSEEGGNDSAGESADPFAPVKRKNTAGLMKGKFFFTEDDSRLDENPFERKEKDDEVLRNKWLEKRPYFIESYKRRMRRYRGVKEDNKVAEKMRMSKSARFRQIQRSWKKNDKKF